MSSPHIRPEALIEAISRPPDDLYDGMIEVIPAKRSQIKRGHGGSSIGTLDGVCSDVLLCILEKLDFQSLSRFSQTSLLAKAVVEKLPWYRDMMDHAPKALTALGKTGLITSFPAMEIRRSLRSSTCATCGGFGVYLFLPLIQRCCFSCLVKNPSLWVMPLREAVDCFDLTREQMKGIPVLYSIPGDYNVGHLLETNQRRHLVSVRATKERAIAVHGSDAHLKVIMAKKHWPRVMAPHFFRFHWYLDAPLGRFNESQWPPPPWHEWTPPRDKFGGMASIYFPAMTKQGEPIEPLWCQGCESDYWSLTLDPTFLSLGPWESHAAVQALVIQQNTALELPRFLEHIKDCKGAREICPDLDEHLP